MFSNKICALVILVMLASSAALAQTSAKKATSQSPMPHTAKGPATSRRSPGVHEKRRSPA